MLIKVYTQRDIFGSASSKWAGRPVILAVRGQWKFTDDEATAQISQVIGTVRAFWHDNNFPYFLVTLKPYDRDHGESDGGAFTNAFWMYVSRLDSLGGLLPQLAHESFHAWDPMRMGGQFGSDSEVNSIKWFGEGPTDVIMPTCSHLGRERFRRQITSDLSIRICGSSQPPLVNMSGDASFRCGSMTNPA
jgi:predicted metalloprotease with PDZ domain